MCYGTAQLHKQAEREGEYIKERGVGTKEISERQEGFPLRHFFHPVTGIFFLYRASLLPVLSRSLSRGNKHVSFHKALNILVF